MSERGEPKRHYLPIALGALSAVLYGTVFLAPAFLMPIQASGARRGYRAMVLSASIAAAASAAIQLALLARAGSLDVSMILMGVGAPVSMIAALTLMALPALGAVPFVYRALGGALVASLATLPTLALAAKDPAVRAMFDAAAGQASQLVGGAAIDAGSLWDAMSGAIASSFAAVTFLFLFASAWTGSRFGMRAVSSEPGLPTIAADTEAESANAQEARKPLALPPALPPPLSEYRVPPALVWPLLGSWAAILLTRYVPVPAAQAIAWNIATALSICYGVQGLAVAVALAGRIGMAPVARAIGPIALVLLLVSGTAGFIAIGLLAVLGTLETWIPFRTSNQGEKP